MVLDIFEQAADGLSRRAHFTKCPVQDPVGRRFTEDAEASVDYSK